MRLRSATKASPPVGSPSADSDTDDEGGGDGARPGGFRRRRVCAMRTRSGRKFSPPGRSGSSDSDTGDDGSGDAASPGGVRRRRVVARKVPVAATDARLRSRNRGVKHRVGKGGGGSRHGAAKDCPLNNRAPLFGPPAEHFLSRFSAHRICLNLPFTEERQHWIKLSGHGALLSCQDFSVPVKFVRSVMLMLERPNLSYPIGHVFDGPAHHPLLSNACGASRTATCPPLCSCPHVSHRPSARGALLPWSASPPTARHGRLTSPQLDMVGYRKHVAAQLIRLPMIEVSLEEFVQENFVGKLK